MNKTAIQRFAIWARTELIAQVSQRAYQYDITADGYGDYDAEAVGGRLLSDEEKQQRQQLLGQIRSKGYAQVMEEVAYTWFNRLIALRFMEVNNYLPSHIRVFSDASGAFKPEILSDALHLDLDGLDMKKVSDLIEKNQSEALYRYLLLTQCNALSGALPRMFEPMGSYTELLLPNNILRQDGVLGRMVTDIPEKDWTDQVQIIGWLYQYYNTELKDETFALLKKNVKITKERIPSATQLFTPDWIVRYMVENSLGRLWLEGHPDDELKAGWKYYLDEAEQEPDVQAQLEAIREEYRALRPQDIKVIDPCMGSGHILVYAFDVLVQIYKKAGFSERDAAQSILENNLYGLDIDDRAAQLAYFAVMMKARQYDRRILTRGIQPQVYGPGVDAEIREYGSLLMVDEAPETAQDGQLSLMDESDAYRRLLAQKHDVVVTNPPYMAVSNASAKVQDFVKKNYPDSKADLFAAFIERCRMLTKANGYQAMITQHAWMFLLSFEKLREKLMQQSIVNMIHLGIGTFEDLNSKVVQSVAFVLRKKHIDKYKGVYHRLFEKQGLQESNEEKQKWLLSGKHRFLARQENFSKIPGSPVAYWVGNSTVQAFKSSQFQDFFFAGHGLLIGHDEGFIFCWYEVNYQNIAFGMHSEKEFYESGKKYCPLAKGGDFRKWYGNLSLVVWYNEEGRKRMSCYPKYTPQNHEMYFRSGVSWTEITSGNLGARHLPEGCIFSHKGPSAMTDTEDGTYKLMGFMASKVANHFTNLINPTITCSAGVMKKVPIIGFEHWNVDIVKDCISLSKSDWDSFETAWDFEEHPLVRWSKALWDRTLIAANMDYFYHCKPRVKSTVELCYLLWQGECNERFTQLKANEEELNRIFIDIYGLQDELTPEVEDRDVTVRRADLSRDIRSLISYAVGCMLGRYSVDEKGLILAGEPMQERFVYAYVPVAGTLFAGETPLYTEKGNCYLRAADGSSKCCTFVPDEDNIIPICDDEYFDDDITGRFVNWVEVVFGKETLEENLKYIADALGGKGTPREVIRSYFLNDFYADHLKIYQKRPIYWLFDSGKKNGFKALIYMHRYRSDLLARMRTDYVHEQQERYRTQLRHIADAMDAASAPERVKLTKRQKKLQEQALELQKYEEKVHHLADQNIEIDLDDGVKHNYALFEDVLAKIK